MPAIKVFYVWQSSRSQKYHRRFIRDSASDACERITLVRSNNFEVTFEESPAVVPGMCDVPTSTLRKIDECDLLLADLTYVATFDEIDRETSTVSKSSNPAVMLQLGYAARTKGISRLVGVKNEIFGGPNDLLLDARRRWIVGYRLQPGKADRHALFLERKVLSRKLEGVMLTAMHQHQGNRRKIQTDRRFQQTRKQFESDVIAGLFPRVDKGLAAIAITVVPANSVKRDLGRLASAMREAAVPFDELVTGGQSVTGFTTETTVEMTSGGVLRAACTGNLNARRAGFPLPPGAAGMIPSNTLERNVVLAVHQYCRLLHDIECPLPWQLGISLLGIHEFTMVVGPGERSDVFDGKKLPADPLIVQDYDAVATRENVARLLKGTFDCIWREFGLGYSRNYDVKGNWTAKL